MANTTWSATDKVAGMTLSGSNLIATITTSPFGLVRSIDKQIAGKFYFELTANTTGNSDLWGLVSSSVSTAPGIGSGSPPGTCWVANNGAIWSDGANPASIGAITSGALICIAFDASARLAWFRPGAAGNWNGSASANPATGAGGVSMTLGLGVPAYVAFYANTTTHQTTANFGGSAFTGAVPAGFTSGFTAGAP